MATDPVPRASAGTIAPRAAVPARGASPVNHARYLVVLALGAFALPAVARVAESFGAPRTPAGVSALLLAVVLIIALLARPPSRVRAAPAAREDSGARV